MFIARSPEKPGTLSCNIANASIYSLGKTSIRVDNN